MQTRLKLLPERAADCGKGFRGWGGRESTLGKEGVGKEKREGRRGSEAVLTSLPRVPPPYSQTLRQLHPKDTESPRDGSEELRARGRGGGMGHRSKTGEVN